MLISFTTCQSVAPGANMQDHERRYSDCHGCLLQVLWLHYLERFRNLQYLEAQLEGYHKAEQDAADAAERRRKKMQRKLA